MFTDTFFAMYDITCTVVAILFYGIFEQDINFNYTNQEHKLGFSLAKYYKHCKENVLEKTMKHYFWWFLLSFGTSAANFYIPFYTF